MEVYHRINTRADVSEITSFDIENYRQVAVIETDLEKTGNQNLNKAYELTNNIWNSWVDNKEVQTKLSQSRSSMVGDVIEVDNKLMMIDSFGFKQIEVK